MTEEMALELKAHLNACNVKRAYNWYNTIFVEHTVNKFKETKKIYPIFHVKNMKKSKKLNLINILFFIYHILHSFVFK